MSLRNVDDNERRIGIRIKLRRLTLGLSQKDLAQRLGLSYQQVQKYEAGKNRLSAGRLANVAQVLNVPITWFFDDADEGVIQATAMIEREDNRDILQLITAFSMIKSPAQRKVVLALVRTLAQGDDSSDQTS